jgi:proline iminopeptidase
MDWIPLTYPGNSGRRRRSLFPEIEAAKIGWLDTGDGHQIYYEESGTPGARPVIVLHGGPGGATNPTMRRFFDPARWHIIMFDQRGCGKSRPNASLDANTTWTLIDDIERVREHFGFESMGVFGGSWGSTLALAYAIKHPQRVRSLVLRGIFLLTQRELGWFYQDGASMLFPDAWERFCQPIPPSERGDMIAAYHRRLTHPDRNIQAEAAAAWSQWEGDTISLRGPDARPSKFNEIDFAIAFARIECHFFANRGFFDHDGWLLDQVDRIAHIPGWIVQGRFDVVTPLESAWSLHKAWSKSQLDIVWDAGHASTEPGIIDGLLRATDAAASV